MFIDLTDLVIYFFSLVLYLICGYGIDRDLNRVYGYNEFKRDDLLVVIIWPIVVVVRSLYIVWDDLK